MNTAASIKLRTPLFLRLLLFACLTGCGNKAEIREYVVEPEEDKVITSEVLRRSFGSIPLKWTQPEGWRTAANDQFSVLAWVTSDQKDVEARVTLTDLPGSAGIVPQIARWRGQIELDDAAPDEMMKDVETIDLGDGQTGSYVQLKGKKESILALILSVEDKMWVLRYRGNEMAVRDSGAEFRRFCESVRVVN
ncbi:MAG: hypothetical protein KDA91_10280 [Planctomycetaceae bacterium]|nr:hypothetical protein [Planctomycetaceae bacterium]